MKRLLLILLCIAPMGPTPAIAQEFNIPLSDLVTIQGVRKNFIYGVGLIVGLNATGDQSKGTLQIISNVLRRLNINIDDRQLSSKNIALVTVTAKLPPFLTPGSMLDVTVSSTGDASSLFGGTLLQTPLQGADGRVYAVAQGPVSVGGFQVEGAAATVRKNHPTAGRIADGAIVEDTVPMKLATDTGEIVFQLREPGFSSARRIAERVRKSGYPVTGLDAATVRFQVPPSLIDTPMLAETVADLMRETIVPVQVQRIVINERTGTIVAGHAVLITAVTIAQGDLRITIAESPEVSQPAPFSDGETTVVPRTTLEVEEEDSKIVSLQRGITAAEMANSLSVLGVTPRDLSEIFHALKKAGALHAELIFL